MGTRLAPSRSFRLPALLALVLIAAVPGALAGPNPLTASVVKIYTVFNRHNTIEPWQRHGQQLRQGSGCIVDGRRILTNAHVISDQTFIQVRRGGEARRYTARVHVVAHECDLALLTVDDESFFSGVPPLQLGELPELQDKVTVYGFPEGGDKLSVTDGAVARIEHGRYDHSRAYLLTCQIDAPINIGNSGGPVIKGGNIAGVAFQSLAGQGIESTGYMVPAPVVRRFFKDIADGRYDGTPELGISMQKLENPDMRRACGMTTGQTGVLVNAIYPDSSARGIIASQDVLLTIDGQPIENDGTIEFRPGERTFFGYPMQLKLLSETIDMELLRDGVRRGVRIPLTRAIDSSRLVPNLHYDIPPEYYLIGGLLFEPLTLDYLAEYAPPAELLHLYLNGEPTETRRRVIVLTKVLADELNIGYHDFQDAVIRRVNGQNISTLPDLIAAFKNNTGTYHVVEDIRGYRLVLDREKVAAQNAALLRRYDIAKDRHLNGPAGDIGLMNR